jgi:ABC-type transport system involved in Fe-S cluster assembly fused permease/ATPase subunit
MRLTQPHIMLFDEVTAALDPETVKEAPCAPALEKPGYSRYRGNVACLN